MNDLKITARDAEPEPATYRVIYPEYQTVTETTIRGWYADAVANGEAPAGSHTVAKIIAALEDGGRVAFGSDAPVAPKPTEPKVIFATVRDSEDENGVLVNDIECRFDDGQKFAAVQVSGELPDLAMGIANFLSMTNDTVAPKPSTSPSTGLAYDIKARIDRELAIIGADCAEPLSRPGCDDLTVNAVDRLMTAVKDLKAARETIFGIKPL